MRIDVFALQKKLNIPVLYFDKIDSTNLYCKSRVKEGLPFRGLVIASAQTNGQGRLGKSFYSPEESGLYLTYSLKNQTFKTKNITAAIAISVCRSLEKTYKVSCGLKWVNDIYMHNRKVGGILCQTVDDYLLIGIGINLIRPKFIPKELENRLGWVLDEKDVIDPSDLILTLYDEINRVFQTFDHDLIDEYRNRCVHIGSEVEIDQNQEQFRGKCVGIDDSFHLLIEINNEVKTFSSGYMILGI